MKKLLSVLLVGIMVLLTVGCGGDKVKELTAAEYVQAFKDAGLEAENAREMTEVDFGPIPQDVKSAQIFYFPSIEESINGHVFVFKNEKNLEQAKKIYDEFGQVFKVYVYDKGNALLHLSGEVNEDRAVKYQEVLNEK